MCRRQFENDVVIARLGVSIHGRELRAVLVRNGRVRWRASVECVYADAGPDAIAKLLESLPKQLGPKRATIAMGLAWCQLKQIDGMPATKNAAMLTRLLRENVDSFFLRRGSRVAVSDVVIRADATVWAAAFDQDVATAAIDALRKRGFAKARVMPSVVAMASILPAGVHCWEDDETIVELTTNASRSIERLRRVGGLKVAPFADDGTRTAAALGAAFAPSRVAFEWRPGPDPRRVARVMRVRVGFAASLAIVAGVSALAAPGVRASRVAREASAELDTLRKAQVEVARAQADLRRAAVTIERVERFREQRGRATVLLGALSQALPESTALVSFRLDSAEGSFVALTPHAADILPQLVSITDVVAPKIVGSLTKETVGGTQLERATVRFRRQRSSAPANVAKPPARGRG